MREKGLDESKDQSYVLYSLSQQALAHALPLGGLDKETVRQIAGQARFVNTKQAGQSGHLLCSGRRLRSVYRAVYAQDLSAG